MFGHVAMDVDRAPKPPVGYDPFRDQLIERVAAQAHDGCASLLPNMGEYSISSVWRMTGQRHYPAAFSQAVPSYPTVAVPITRRVSNPPSLGIT